MKNSFCSAIFRVLYIQVLSQFTAHRIRPGKLGVLLGFVFSATILVTGTAHATITARVTMNTYAEFASQNPAPGHISFMRASIPNAGNNYDATVAWQDITGNVTNLAVNLGTSPGYFTMAFNNNNYSGATSCSSNVDFNTSSAYIADGGSFDVTITCTVPDTTPPTPQSAATNAAGTTVTITFDESVAASDGMASASDFTVTANATPVTISSLSFSGTTAILTLANPVYAGQTVKVSYDDSNQGLVDDAWNPAVSFTDLAVTNNSTASGNVAPTFIGATTTLTVNQNAFATDIKSLLHVSDTDSSQTETWTQSVAPNHGGTLSFSSATASSGTSDITPGGTITYKPANGYSGTETFTVQVSDGTATATRQITVTIIPLPTVTTNAASSISSTDATMNGTVNANEYSTDVTFDYGTTASYGTSTAANPSPITGSANTAVLAAVSGLTCNTLYHFRVKGVNTAGTVKGSDLTFTTAACNVAPTFVGVTTTLSVNQNAFATDIKSLLHVSDADASQTETWTQSVAPDHGGTLSFSSATASSGSTDITPGGTITYTPANGYSGTETFTVQVSDGTATTTRQITVTVVPPPTVTSVSVPSAATYVAGQNLDFTVNFSENVTVTGTDSTLGLTIGSSARTAVYQSKSATSITYRYTVQSGDIDTDGIAVGTLTLNSTTIQDAASNNATLTLNSVGSTAGVLVDSLVPTATAANAITFTGFNANWGAVAGATGYYLDVATDSGFTSFATGYSNNDVGNVTTIAVTGLTTGTPYYYRVRAYNSNGTSADSNTIALTTAMIRVVTTSNDSGAGSLRQITTDANPGDVITFDSSLDGQTITVATDIIIDKDMTINGLGAPNLTISGGDTTRIFSVNSGKTVQISGLTLSHGKSFDGPAIFNSGVLTVSNTTISGNYAQSSSGSGIYNNPGATLTVTGCTISGNAADVLGGGVYNNNGTATITNTTIAGNSAMAGGGGGILNNSAGTLTVENSTIAGNASGGLINLSGGTATIRNAIFWGSGSYLSGVATISDSIVTNGCYPGSTCTNVSSADPLLGTLGNYGGTTGTIPLLANSPAIDAGNCASGPATDQRGMARPQDATCDIGAYERGVPAALTATAGTSQSTVINTAFGTALAAKVVDSLGGALDGISVAFTGPGSGAGISTSGNATSNASGNATYSVTANGTAGSYTVAAAVNTLSANFSLTNDKGSQAILFNTAPTVVVDGTGTVSATGGASTSPVAYSSLTTSICTISGTTVTGVTAGTCTIAANQAGDTNYNAAPQVTQDITVGKGTATVTLGNLSATYDGTAKSATATTTPVGLTVTITYNGSATAPTTAGSYTVVATVSDANYTGSATDTLVIAKAAATVTLGSLSATYDGTAKAASATTTPAGLTVTFTYDGSASAPTDAGSYAVVAAINDSNYSGTATGTLAIAKAGQTITFDPLAAKTYGAADFGPGATVDTGLPITYASDTTTVATITAGGLIHITGAGNTVITATQAGDTNHLPATAQQTLTVGKALITVTADNKSRDYAAPDPTFTATYTGFVNGENTAVISGAPTFTTDADAASPVGSYTITPDIAALTAANYTFTAVNGTLAVGIASQTIVFNPLSPMTYGAGQFDLSATGGASGNPVTFTSSDPAVATISGTTVTIIGAGSTTITASQAGTPNMYASATAQQTLTVNKAHITLTADNKQRTYNTPNPTFTGVYSGFVNSEDASVIGGTPTFTTTATQTSPTGSYPITPVVSGLTATNYDFVAADGTLAIDVASQTITFDPLTAMTYGAAPFDLVATGGGSGNPVTFASSNPAVATISGTTVTIVGAGSTTITASQAGDANYASATAQQGLTVSKATLTVTAQAASRVYNSVEPSFSATYSGFVNGDNQGVILGAPTLSTTAILTSPVGSYPITPAIGNLAADNYLFSFVNGTLTITQATPVITWTNPAAITYGTALDATQLNATASVAGSFSYAPPAGSVLNAGAGQTLTVTFTPADTTNYAGATANVAIAVNKATATVTLDNLAQTFDGTAKAATVTTTPATLPVSVTYNGTAAAPVAVGSYAVLATVSDANYQGNATGTLVVTKATPVITWANPAAITYGTALSATQLNATTGVAGTLAYNPAAGTVLGAGTQTLGVTFTPADTANYGTSTASVTLDVAKAPQSITFAALPTKQIGDAPFTIGATATSGLPVAFASSNPAVATVSGTTVTIVGAGTATITASQTGTANYAAATSVAQALTVAFNGAAPQLTVSALSDGATTTDTTQNISGTVFDLNGISSLTVNGTSVTINPDGSFSFPVQLVAGANTITVIATSKSGATASDVRTINMDSTAPYLKVDYPPDNKVLIQNNVTVTGTISELLATGKAVAKTVAATGQAVLVTYTVNGSAPQTATLTDTNYSFTVSLDQGMNTIQVMAINSEGKTSQAKRTLSYMPAFSLAITDPASDVRTVLDSYLLTGTVADNTTPVSITVTMDGQSYSPAVVGGVFQQQLTLGDAKVYQVSVTGTDQNSNSLTVQRNIIKTVPKAVSGSTEPFTIVDALLALKMSVGIITPQTDQVLRLDVAPLHTGVAVGDGKIDIEDALVILRMAVGLL